MHGAWASQHASNPQDVETFNGRSVTHRTSLLSLEIGSAHDDGQDETAADAPPAAPMSPHSLEFQQRFGSLRVLGVEISGLSTVHQFVACTTVLFFFTILYGYLQELVAIVVFERKFGLLVTLLQFSGYTFFAFLQWASRANKRATSMPILFSVSLAVLQASMQGLSNLSMRYLNYPAKVLFKSSKVIPTMLFGVVFYGKRYSWKQYLVMFVLVSGLVVFMQADAITSPEFNPLGVVLVVFSLMVDAGTINLQEYVFTHFHTDEEEMIFFSYAGGSCLLLLICMATGEMNQGLSFLQRKGDTTHVMLIIIMFAACGFCGVSCVAALTKRFGALTASLTTTARKAVTIMLSFALFPKPVAPGHVIGAFLFSAGLVCKIKMKDSYRTTGDRPVVPSAHTAAEPSALGGGTIRKQSDDVDTTIRV